ncbi:MAG: Bestrophin, RFP-TM, chloride channel-domain-containing protein [Monoraphidium minutum]|nr:MAG: Bestrophin, RFP-TM, chloride channel-domain-containing protein [Monoraphidium minutum]
MFTSRVIWGLARPLLFVAAISAAVVAYEALRAAGLLHPALPSVQLTSKEPFGLTSFALSLLLVFRTNASYARWDEARKMWGLVLNRTRDIVRQGLTYIAPERWHLRDMLVRWAPAFSKALMCHLRKGNDLREELQDILLPHEVDALLQAKHRPNYVLQVLSTVVSTCGASVPGTLKMDENLTAFADCLGGCERILRTPIPLSYTRHTSRFLIIWLTLLPFSLVGSCGLATIPLSIVIAFLLLGIEEIGVSIEEPFSILPLETISETALTNARELAAHHGGGPAPAAAAGAAAEPAPLSAAQLIQMAAAAAVPRPAYNSWPGPVVVR